MGSKLVSNHSYLSVENVFLTSPSDQAGNGGVAISGAAIGGNAY